MINTGVKIIEKDGIPTTVPDINGIENMRYKAYYYDNDTRCEVEIIEDEE